MRKAFPASIAAKASWPSSDGGIHLPPFNWVLIENRGTIDVFVTLGGSGTADKQLFYRKVKSGTTRVFNCAAPRDAEGRSEDTWPQELSVFNADVATAAQVLIEIADHPIIDFNLAN